MRVLVVTHPTPKNIKEIMPLKDSDYIIAVDQAVFSLYKQRIPIHLAVGDFDSLTNHGMLINLNVIRLDPIKDVTDTHQALVEATKVNPDELYLIGGMGGNRIEHFMVHTMFFNEFPMLIMKDEHSTIYVLDKGIHEFNVQNHYVSFFAYPRALLTLVGFKYDLTEYILSTYDPLCISNELAQDKGFIEIKEGKVMVVISKK